MRRVMVVAAMMLVAAIAVSAARGAQVPQGAPAPATAPTCPPSGYSPPFYAMFGQNGGDGQTAYEIASPCIGKEVRDAAIAIGMGRNRLLGVKNVITIMFTAGGTFAGDKLSKADFHVAYYLPAMRMFLEGTRRNGAALKEIRVFADTYAWNETEEGRGATPAMNTLEDRAPLIKLTPFGALWSVIEAEGHAKVSTVNGRTVLTGTSPLDGIEVSTTLDNQSRPIEVTANTNGHTYGATFADYRDTWESKYLVIFPSQIKWTLDGKPLADLTVTAFKSNPYVVFPVPDVVRQKASN